MNFISTFDELNKLYESDKQPKAKKEAEGQLKEYYDEECPNGRTSQYSYGNAKSWGDPVPQWWKDQGGTAQSWKSRDKSGYRHDEETGGDRRDRWTREDLAEDSDENIFEDEISAEEAPVEEPRQVICECDKCGALVIKDEADIVVDEETDLVNVEDECQFCEEAKGFKIIGVVAPYEVAGGVVEEPVEESLHNSKLLKEIEKTNELKTEHESEYLTLNEEVEDIIDEDLADIYRKTFDKPASAETQQAWEDELNGEMGEISDKRRAHLEKKFAQQRDWEARHEADAE